MRITKLSILIILLILCIAALDFNTPNTFAYLYKSQESNSPLFDYKVLRYTGTDLEEPLEPEVQETQVLDFYGSWQVYPGISPGKNSIPIITPEPIAAELFFLGAGILAMFRHRKKSSLIMKGGDL